MKLLKKIYSLDFFDKLIFAIIAGLLVIGFLVYRDYGVTVDEPTQRFHGLVAFKHIASLIDDSLSERWILDGVNISLDEYPHKYYGISWHLILLIGEYFLGLGESLELVWKYRHLMNFLFCFIGSLALFDLLRLRFNKYYALIGWLTFWTTPRMFGESFFNIKDMIFWSAFTISLYLMYRFLKNEKWSYLIFFTISLAFATNIRILALILLPIVTFILIVKSYRNHKFRNYKEMILKSVSVVISSLVFIVFLWPSAWNRPFNFLFEVFLKMSKYEAWNGYLIYMGNLIIGQDRPWHYTLVWIGVTTPIVYLITQVFGIVISFKSVYKFLLDSKFSLNLSMDVTSVMVILGTLSATEIFDSRLYGSWRHTFFLYTPILYLGVLGLSWMIQFIKKLDTNYKTYAYSFLIFGLFFQITVNIVWMFRYHPHQNVYFNSLAGNVANNFDRDYWKGSYKQGLEWIYYNYPDKDELRVLDYYPIEINLQILDPEKRSKFVMVDKNSTDQQAEFFINSFRAIQGNESYNDGLEVQGLEVYSIWVDDFKILSVHQL